MAASIRHVQTVAFDTHKKPAIYIWVSYATARTRSSATVYYVADCLQSGTPDWPLVHVHLRRFPVHPEEHKVAAKIEHRIDSRGDEGERRR